ncbi:hypothetical protein MMEU_1312 [Mycobacterium marinum str. Europe]|nr:hypothetical protein MMEU_1312 [Mycobacterium marinum str. Europe]
MLRNQYPPSSSAVSINPPVTVEKNDVELGRGSMPANASIKGPAIAST